MNKKSKRIKKVNKDGIVLGFRPSFNELQIKMDLEWLADEMARIQEDAISYKEKKS